jgi:hypothetical protein|tara:strand:- start:27 stop:833 length:807 start_codon:yes stop_codon:yes gene_type:complete
MNLYAELARLWPVYALLFLALQFIFPRLLRNTVPETNPTWNWIHGTTRSGGKAAEYLSFLFISGTVVTFSATLAYFKWSDIQSIPEEQRLYASIPEAQLLASVMLGYQIYNFAMCFILPKDNGKFENYCHHFSTALLSYFVMGPYVHYYAFFFIGVAETTNVPLTIVDACRAFPRLREMYPTVNTLSRGLFAVSFLVIRVCWWPYVSYSFWLLSIELLKKGGGHNVFVIYSFLFGSVGLTLLQLVWGSQIIGFVKATFSTKKTIKKKQ